MPSIVLEKLFASHTSLPGERQGLKSIFDILGSVQVFDEDEIQLQGLGKKIFKALTEYSFWFVRFSTKPCSRVDIDCRALLISIRQT